VTCSAWALPTGVRQAARYLLRVTQDTFRLKVSHGDVALECASVQKVANDVIKPEALTEIVKHVLRSSCRLCFVAREPCGHITE
jgi:hypothetical protein